MSSRGKSEKRFATSFSKLGKKGNVKALIAHLIKSGVSARLVKRFKKETQEEKC